MDNIRIQTTQNVDIEYDIASVGDRILATLLDYAFFLAYILFCLFIIGLLFRSTEAYIYIIFSLPVLFYDLLCETFFEGKSFGKMIMKIKVVKLDGTQAGFGAYLMRWLFRIIDTRLFSGGLALVSIVMSEKGQRLGDLAAGTTVIKIKQRVKLSDTIYNKVKPDYTIVFPEVSHLSDNDISIIKDVMKVSLASKNAEAMDKLAAKTKAAMGITTAMPSANFLYTVLQDYNFYNFDK